MSDPDDAPKYGPNDLVGPVEVAEMCAVKADTVYQWVTRGLLPEPLRIISNTRIWSRREIEKWAAATGRMPRAE